VAAGILAPDPLRVTHAETDERLVELWPRMGAARELLPGIAPELLGSIDLASWIARALGDGRRFN
jgi:hypothetical protein